ncbi:MAG: UDP-glucose 4-epimerase GalE [Synergistaceae bacterium]|nr:UDP-glucose 4-epimerase GalE [Synergistaceae bacterium]
MRSLISWIIPVLINMKHGEDKMQYCIVTGGAGYVGSHCCKELAKNGFIPVTVDNLSRGHKELVKWGPFFECDVLDETTLSSIITKYMPVAVFHFAGLTYVGESVKDPEPYYRNNTAGTISLLKCMKKSGCSKIIFSSTAAIYGNPEYTPINENHPQRPINPYGKSKLFIEEILKDFDSAYGIKYAALRYFNACGADEDGDTGELHDPETHLIPLTIQAAIGIKENIKVFGDDYDTHDGTALRDYIHVSDLANAHVKALQLLLEGSKSIYANLGTGKALSVMEVIESVEKISGKKIKKIVVPRRDGDPQILVADPSKARSILEWKCHFSSIDKIVKTALEWHKNHS